MRLTEEQAKKDLDIVSRRSENDEKLAWRRKKKKLEGFLEELQPYEDQMLELYKQKQSIMDKIEELRQVMVQECIHPKDQLIHKGTHVECKFCNKMIKPRR